MEEQLIPDLGRTGLKAEGPLTEYGSSIELRFNKLCHPNE